MSYIPDGITLAFAIIGAVLGILNTWHTINRDRVKLLVVPRYYIASSGISGICIDVTNLSFLPVTVTQVAIELGCSRNQIFVFHPLYLDDTCLPHRMEPRTSITVFIPPGIDRDPRLIDGRRALAKTACGRTFYGSSPAFKDHIRKLRAV